MYMHILVFQQTPVIIKQEIKQKPKKQSDVKANMNGQSTNDAAIASQVVKACEALWTCEDTKTACEEISNTLKYVAMHYVHYALRNVHTNAECYRL